MSQTTQITSDEVPETTDPFGFGAQEFVRRDGSTPMLAQLPLLNGSQAVPAWGFVGNSRSGPFRRLLDEAICWSIDAYNGLFCMGVGFWELWVSGIRGAFTHSNTGDRTYIFPDKDGTIATTEDVEHAEVLAWMNWSGF